MTEMKDETRNVQYGKKRLAGWWNRAAAACFAAPAALGVRMEKLKGDRGQGTTEYAILVGIIVVIAIIAITVFRPKLQELWDSIATNINSL